MTASSIAQYLEQRRNIRPGERAAASRPDPWAALTAARAAAESEDGEPAAAAKFRPLSFKAAESPAPAPRSALLAAADFGASASEGTPSRSSSALFRAREPAPPQPDIEERLTEAYHRGVQEGLDAARSEASTARAMERAELQKRAAVERVDFQMNEYAKLAEEMTHAIGEVERRIADNVARILRPLMLVSVTSRAVEELAANISKLSSAGRPPLLKISGPEPLLKLLKARTEALAIEFEFVPTTHIEVKAEASHTTIATELGPWLELIHSLCEDAD